MKYIQNFINGNFTNPISNAFLENFEPATGKVYSMVTDSDAQDVELAVAAAASAFPKWSKLPTRERAKILRKLSYLIEENKDSIAQAESIDTGKPVSLASILDIPRSALNLEFFADAITQFSSESYYSADGTAHYTTRSPLGVIACISPWNLPLYLLTWKIAPALAAGNTVIAKPSELTPMTAFLFAQFCKQAGLPDGVLNIVHGTGPKVGSSICKNPYVKAVSFTGSTATGTSIAQITAPFFKKVSLEMGGKNATIVFSDCDFETAVQQTVRSAFLNQGQICLCGSRIFIQKPIYEKFKQALIEKIKQLKIGDPLDVSTDQGAIVSKAHFEKVLSYIDLAKKEEGHCLTGGSPVRIEGRCKEGWFIAPTLFENLSVQCRTNQEEIFGPVATLIPFDTEEEVVESANRTSYGLAASIFTNNISRAYRVASQLDTGIVWINCWMARDLRTPFGGVKKSGLGREGGLEALRFFTETKSITVKATEVSLP